MEGANDDQANDYDKTFLEDPAILDKYKAAADVSERALQMAIDQCVDGADVFTVCQAVDAFVEEELTKVFSGKKSKKLERGIAFPCCISVNEMCGHFSPLQEDSITLKTEDLVKIQLGAHIDGFPAECGHTIVIGGKSKGKQADVINAAWNAFQAATKTIKPENTNQMVTAKIQAVCEEFGVEALQGVLSHKTKKHLNDGNEVIINKETPDQRVEDWTFEAGDVIHLDVYTTSGDGMSRKAETRCTVFKRQLDQQYSLKSKHSRSFFSVVNSKYPTLPFTVRGFEDTVGAKVGVKECLEHDLLMDYPVLTDKAGEYVAQFKATVVVQPKSTALICGNKVFDAAGIVSEKKIKNEELAALVAGPLWKQEKAKKDKK